MALELDGKVIQILPEQSGTSNAGKSWRKQSFVIETEEQYPKKVVFNSWNDNVESIKQLTNGTKVKISFRVESREFNERWYTDLTAWKITKVVEQNLTTAATQQNVQTPQEQNNAIYEEDNSLAGDDINISNESKEEDDLPF